MFLREKEEEVKESMRERAEKQSITRESIERKGRGGEGGWKELALVRPQNPTINMSIHPGLLL